jgi:hypothetical protein
VSIRTESFVSGGFNQSVHDLRLASRLRPKSSIEPDPENNTETLGTRPLFLDQALGQAAVINTESSSAQVVAQIEQI